MIKHKRGLIGNMDDFASEKGMIRVRYDNGEV